MHAAVGLVDERDPLGHEVVELPRRVLIDPSLGMLPEAAVQRTRCEQAQRPVVAAIEQRGHVRPTYSPRELWRPRVGEHLS